MIALATDHGGVFEGRGTLLYGFVQRNSRESWQRSPTALEHRNGFDRSALVSQSSMAQETTREKCVVLRCHLELTVRIRRLVHPGDKQEPLPPLSDRATLMDGSQRLSALSIFMARPEILKLNRRPFADEVYVKYGEEGWT
jgi:hypothetical protein